MSRLSYVVDAESVVEPSCKHVEGAAVVFKVPALFVAVYLHHVLQAGGVGAVGFVVVEHKFALRYLETVLVAAVACAGTHQRHSKEQYGGNGHKCPEP